MFSATRQRLSKQEIFLIQLRKDLNHIALKYRSKYERYCVTITKAKRFSLFLYQIDEAYRQRDEAVKITASSSGLKTSSSITQAYFFSSFFY